MLEVLLLGVFVAYTKLGDLVTIELGPAVYALGLLTVVWVWAEVAFDPHAVWEEIERRGQTHAPMPAEAPLPGDRAPWAARAAAWSACRPRRDGHCPRCGSTVHERKPNSVSRTWALVIAAVVLYIPANVYPVLTVIQLGAGEPSTIMGGVEELLDSGMYPLAALVFFASIMVPLFKLLGLGTMLTATQLGRPGAGASMLIRERTVLYHIVAWIGRWSMVDIFMELLLGALVQFGRAVTIEPGVGALAFCAVVFITIFAAETFDPRLMWDAAGRNPHRAPAERPGGSRSCTVAFGLVISGPAGKAATRPRRGPSPPSDFCLVIRPFLPASGHRVFWKGRIMSELPARPSKEHLRKQAKRLARDKSLGLAEAQRKLAADYGANTWAELDAARRCGARRRGRAASTARRGRTGRRPGGGPAPYCRRTADSTTAVRRPARRCGRPAPPTHRPKRGSPSPTHCFPPAPVRGTTVAARPHCMPPPTAARWPWSSC